MCPTLPNIVTSTPLKVDPFTMSKFLSKNGNLYSRLRYARVADARLLGAHSKKEWEDMKRFFEETCAACLGKSGLSAVERDHIIPIYQGGSDSIKNIQPLCAKCNSQKGASAIDLRPKLSRFLNKRLPKEYQP